MKKIIVLILAGVFLAGLSSISLAAAKKDIVPIGTEIGNSAPDFSLQDIEGKTHTLKDMKGKKVVVIVFWATWCPYCVNEIPELIKIQEKYADKNLEVWSVNIKESKEKVISFTKKRSVNYTALLDRVGSVASTYQILGIPANIIVDKNGIIVSTGQLPNDWQALLDKLTQDVKVVKKQK